MKVLLRLLPVLALAGTCSLAHAQQAVTQEEGHLPKKGKRLESSSPANGVFMKEGRMMTMRDGAAQPMTAPMTMDNGTKVMTDGSVIMADGKTMMLHNGQHLRLDGTLLDPRSAKSKDLNRKSL